MSFFLFCADSASLNAPLTATLTVRTSKKRSAALVYLMNDFILNPPFPSVLVSRRVRLAAFVRVAPVAIERFPCGHTVVALTTEVAPHDLGHVDVVGTFLKDKDVLVTYLTFESDSMKPVWKYHGFHVGLLHAL